MLVHPPNYQSIDRSSRINPALHNTRNPENSPLAVDSHTHSYDSHNTLAELQKKLIFETQQGNHKGNSGEVAPPSLVPHSLGTELHSGSSHFPIATQQAHIPEHLRDMVELLYLQQRDRQVRAHENSHLVAANGLAGIPVYQYERGADGKNYAVSGKLNMDTHVYTGKQDKQLDQLQKIYRAALAPLNPSAKDLQIATLIAHKIRTVEHQIASEISQNIGTSHQIMVVSDHYQLRNVSKIGKTNIT